MSSSYTTPGQPTGGAGPLAPNSKGIPRATSFFGCIFLKQVRATAAARPEAGAARASRLARGRPHRGGRSPPQRVATRAASRRVAPWAGSRLPCR